MHALRRFLETSVGRKTVLAITGLSLFGFVIVHLLGNFALFSGTEAFNEYAQKLEDLGPVLMVAEVGLLTLFVVHMGLALSLHRQSREARPDDYRIRANMGRSTVASRSMLITGLALGVFLVIHITDFRIKKIMGDPAVADLGQAVVERITSPLGLVIYMGGIIALGLHLRHALQSAFQTLGLSHPRYADNVRYVSAASAALITLGFAAIPLYLLFTGQGASS
ncbi:MAG TPA: succinate dehydrogenase cytochrome b subunit [Planctomycetes bacterium]|nr:succinate dehydrogenase cytochrome b subunit [Planctomycetota bacterium]HIL38564.1 succinate dehydrogenase cytochrome b subunit [Planctomycetota bacterium]